jgi:hypothetical protein
MSKQSKKKIEDQINISTLEGEIISINNTDQSQQIYEKPIIIPKYKKKSLKNSKEEILDTNLQEPGEDNLNETEYIYLIREREFIRTNDNIYKVGRTKQQINNSIRRFDEYPKGSEPIFLMKVNSSIKAEAEVIKMLKQEYKQRLEYGKEYFEGDVNCMILSIIKKIGCDDITNKKLNEELNSIKIKYENLKLKIKNTIQIEFQNLSSNIDNLLEN